MMSPRKYRPRSPKPERRIVIQAIRQDPTDLEKVAAALLLLTQQPSHSTTAKTGRLQVHQQTDGQGTAQPGKKVQS